MTRPVHPTKAKLLDTAVLMLNSMPAESITTEALLERSGISRSSLYHHFSDFSDLLGAAEVVRFTHFVDISIEMLANALEAKDQDDLRDRLLVVTRKTQNLAIQHIRSRRVQVLADAYRNERFRQILGAEQERLTDALTDIVRELQARGWTRSEVDPRAVAILIQAYTIGRAVDDITPNHVNPEAWIALIDDIMDRVLLAPRV
jgi:AcrR family transcriptional regulator